MLTKKGEIRLLCMTQLKTVADQDVREQCCECNVTGEDLLCTRPNTRERQMDSRSHVLSQYRQCRFRHTQSHQHSSVPDT